MSLQPSDQACSESEIIVTQKELPLSCPMPNMTLWNAHPKIYLPIEKTGTEVCPYCGTRYVLAGAASE